jgi:alkylation response protein AidB-like acyl-CoA dehydrogenase
MAGAMAKCFASDVAMEVTTNAVQPLAGFGYTKESPSSASCATPRSPRSTRVPTRCSAW